MRQSSRARIAGGFEHVPHTWRRGRQARRRRRGALLFALLLGAAAPAGAELAPGTAGAPGATRITAEAVSTFMELARRQEAAMLRGDHARAAELAGDMVVTLISAYPAVFTPRGELTPAARRRPPDVARLLADAEERLGLAATRLGDYATAAEAFARAQLLAEAFGPQPPAIVAEKAKRVGYAYSAAGRPVEAEMWLRRAASAAMLAPGTPDTAALGARRELAQFLIDLGRAAEAEQILLDNLSALARAALPDRAETAAQLETLALAYRAEGAHRAAADVLERAVALSRQPGGAPGPRTAGLLSALAAAQQAAGDYAAAEASWRESLRATSVAGGARDPVYAMRLKGLTEVLRTRAESESRPPAIDLFGFGGTDELEDIEEPIGR
ncbi:MAG: tetratricopeptide repeat protein [Alphaproteobacteria bacterium]|nr:MAG: tetratricopeptide repeat protein [Alphaproteobacteria bacterium]